jgi:23S rRNA (adenine2503-C2)-methyltransferase
MKEITPMRSFYLPSGRVIVSKTSDGHFIESTEMRDVTVDGKNHAEVRETFDPKVIWRHLAPIEDKWLLTVSTQVGCTYACKFCDVAQLGFKRNLTANEIDAQIDLLMHCTPEIMFGNGTRKAKIGFARMGEPMQNLYAVLKVISFLGDRHPGVDWLPCFNSIVPKKIKRLTGEYLSGLDALKQVLDVKEDICDGRIHLQISVNSTDEKKRQELFNGADVTEIKDIIEIVNSRPVHNRTVTLNFIAMQGVEISVDKLMQWNLNPSKFAVKIIPLNATLNAQKNVLETQFNYSSWDKMKELEEQFKKEGVPVVTDAVAKCEEAALCCGQLVREYWPSC